MLKRKKGATAHLEMIIAFSFFIIFVAFVFMILEPNSRNKNVLQYTIMQGMHSKFIESNSKRYIKIFLKENSSTNCFSLDVSEITSDIKSTDNIIVLNASSLEKVATGFSYPNLYVNSSANENDFYYIIVSEEFRKQTEISCANKLTNYSLGSIETRNILSNKSLHKFKEDYESDYESVKKKYNIPENYDIGIASDYISLKKEIPENIEVIAKTYNEEVLFENGTTQYIDFTIMVW